MKFTKTKSIIVILLLLICASTIATLEVTNKTHFFHKETIEGKTQSEYTKGEPRSAVVQPQNSGGTTSKSSTVSSSKDSVATQETAPLVKPSGNFVSNHHASLAKSNRETSSCNTTPGASCTITFTKDGITKSLSLQIADDGGATYWSWTLQGLGLTQGVWVIQARANLGSQNLTNTDALSLEVSE